MGCSGGKATATQPAEIINAGPNTMETTQPKAGSKKNTKSVMGKYEMSMTKEAIMGEGRFSICRRGTDATGKQVAIKVYKEQSSKSGKLGGKIQDKTLQKVKRQIAVLQELMEPFQKPSDPTLWDDALAQAEPGHVFMRLLDYSRNSEGQPGPDPVDGVLYVVTELGQYTLKDFLSDRRSHNKPLSKDEVQNMSKSILFAVACLHAKGFVHLDIKPENIMFFNGKLKVIDLDGCVKIGTKLSIQDQFISFSAGYCAPEWARFALDNHRPNIIIANPALDAWGVGVTLSQLAYPDAPLKPPRTVTERWASSDRGHGILFMEWISSLKEASLPKMILDFDPRFLDLLSASLLVVNAKNRMTCAQALSHAFIKASKGDVDAIRTDRLSICGDKKGPDNWLGSETTEITQSTQAPVSRNSSESEDSELDFNV
jgi:serine/threonine protein kinase